MTRRGAPAGRGRPVDVTTDPHRYGDDREPTAALADLSLDRGLVAEVEVALDAAGSVIVRYASGAYAAAGIDDALVAEVAPMAALVAIERARRRLAWAS